MSHPSTLSDYTHLSVSPQYTVRLYTPQCLIPVHSLIIHISVSHSHPSALFDYKHLSVSSSTVSHYTHLCITQHSVSLYTSVCHPAQCLIIHICLIQYSVSLYTSVSHPNTQSDFNHEPPGICDWVPDQADVWLVDWLPNVPLCLWSLNVKLMQLSPLWLTSIVLGKLQRVKNCQSRRPWIPASLTTYSRFKYERHWIQWTAVPAGFGSVAYTKLQLSDTCTQPVTISLVCVT